MDWLPLIGRLFALYLMVSLVLTVRFYVDRAATTKVPKEHLLVNQGPVLLSMRIRNPSPMMVLDEELGSSEVPQNKSAQIENFQNKNASIKHFEIPSHAQMFPFRDDVPSATDVHFFEYYDGVMAKRRAVIERECPRGARGSAVAPDGFSWRNLIFMKEEKILWCPIFKAGSTSWIDYIFTDISLAPKVIPMALFISLRLAKTFLWRRT